MSLLLPSTSAQWAANKSSKVQCLYRVVDTDHTISEWAGFRKTFLQCTEFENRNSNSYRYLKVRKHSLFSHKPKKARNIFLFASADDGVTVNGSPEASTSKDVEAMRISLDQALKNEDYKNGLVQSLYDAARFFELSIKEQSSLSKMSWFSAAWLGVDKNAWAKTLSYQASVYALLQAANEISSRRDGRDREINAAVQRSLLRLSAPLESVIREKLSGKQSVLFEWFWSQKIPVVVATFVDHFERDPRFRAVTLSGNRTTPGSGTASDISLLVLALVCTAAILKLGPAKISCSQFYSMIPDITGSLMDVLVGTISIHEAYHAVKEIGLPREFLVHFGPRAAFCGVTDDCETDEMVFWVDLVQKKLQRAISREKLWSRLTTSESIEVLEKDLAIFGFFVALGRSTKSFLAANGFDKIAVPIEGFIRYLVGGCVLYYPQFSSISSYELYVEVVCEELDWFPFYPGYSNAIKGSPGHNNKSKSPPNPEAVPQALDVCSRWIRVFIKHSKWVENPSNVKAAWFLSKGLHKLGSSMEELGLLKDELSRSKIKRSVERVEANTSFSSREDPYSFDKALENVEEALVRLETLIQEMHVSSSGSGKDHLKAACSDLEKIRKLKKEAEFLEASFRAKAASLQEENDDVKSISTGDGSRSMKGKDGALVQEKNNSNPLGLWNSLWNFLFPPLVKKPGLESSKTADTTKMQGNRSLGLSSLSNADTGKSDSNEIYRFEILRSELMELEKRVQSSTTDSESEEETEYPIAVRGTELIQVQKDESLIGKSFEKLKETSTDVWQGTQLLAIDVAAAAGLLRRAIIGDELTEKEKKYLRRTCTDMASVVPIGVLMLLPVTAVGHAAMLAAIQRYVPALIPSPYGSERLDLLRQLEKVKQTSVEDSKLEENVEDST
ncbi:uncharacterized protein LOC110729935 isoform X1 [Chenopodium quinoa]|uniref:uncharacterized protein LOC110729935 isoform X1 n=1 Tax=Chenopodium quinoa TaxID=63459 RepID=UPI000B795F77|nr:uncharacterized protein LOC110729935 isoform X1 [Chenopodium quinoa]